MGSVIAEPPGSVIAMRREWLIIINDLRRRSNLIAIISEWDCFGAKVCKNGKSERRLAKTEGKCSQLMLAQFSRPVTARYRISTDSGDLR
jgi:hypothetical protein